MFIIYKEERNMINKKLEKLVEEIISSQAAAKPVATKEGTGEISTPSLTNASVYTTEKHKQVEEVKEVIVESVEGEEPEVSESEETEDSREEAAQDGEYDFEGDMAKSQLRVIADAAAELHNMLDDEENLPEWVQSKITLAKDYIDTARDYLKSESMEDDMGEEQEIEVGYGPEVEELMESLGFKNKSRGLEGVTDYLAHRVLSEMSLYGKNLSHLAAMSPSDFQTFLNKEVLAGKVDLNKIRTASPEMYNSLVTTAFSKANEPSDYQTEVLPYGRTGTTVEKVIRDPSLAGLTVNFKPTHSHGVKNGLLGDFLKGEQPATPESVRTNLVTTDEIDALKDKLLPVKAIKESVSPKNSIGRPSNKSLRLKVKGGHVMNSEGEVVPFSQLKKGGK
jgi:hypothetical protein